RELVELSSVHQGSTAAARPKLDRALGARHRSLPKRHFARADQRGYSSQIRTRTKATAARQKLFGAAGTPERVTRAMRASVATPLSLGVLVSGNGSNLQAILDGIDSGRLDAQVKIVVSNRAGVRALERATSAGVTARAIPHRDFANREEFDRAL